MRSLESLKFPESHIQIYKNMAQSSGLILEQEIDLSPDRFTNLIDGSRAYDGHLMKELLEFSIRVTPKGISTSAYTLRHLEFSAHGILGMALTAASTVRNALDIYLKFQEMIMPAIFTRVRYQPEITTIMLKPVADFGELNGLVIENTMGCMGLFMRYTNKPIKFEKVTFSHKSDPDADYHSEYFPGGYLFDQAENKAVIATSMLETQIKSRNIPLANQLILEVEKRYKEIPGSLASQVYRQLLQQAEQGKIMRQEELADQYHMSVRTLSRRLHDEGLNFQSAQKEIKMVLAKQYLRLQPPLSITQVANKSGFASTPSFVRAFKNFYNTTPGYFQRYG